jgi:serine/threonine protein kinase
VPGRLGQVKAIFVEALELSGAERLAYLDRACAQDAKLRVEVEAYLSDEQQAGEFLTQPGLRRDATRDALLDLGLREGPGTVIGRYKVLQLIGEGGCGSVFLAEQQEPVRRMVALKIIKLGMDTRQVIARFETERQVLALMDHPNIARVLDADTDERGRPYFVMEYVPGSPITKYADENLLSIRQRLELVLQVCDAVGHAHAKAIIHRDIKASNVLAYTTPEGPRVKVIDFGVAKALSTDRQTDRTSGTALGQAIGTYESMSPEQADGSPDIDTRADVYALGVLLYELLSGSKPFDKSNLARSADVEVRRIIREDEPPRPSAQLSSLGGEATKIAKARKIEVEALTRQLRSELDWIPLMALRKQRERRYATPQQLAEDIKAYLEGKPLIAAPDSTRYRVSKFVRRNRGAVLAGSSLLAVLLLGIAGTTLGLIGQARAKIEAIGQKVVAEQATGQALAEKRKTEAALREVGRQRDRAQQEQQEAEQQTAVAEAVSRFQAGMLAKADPVRFLGDKVTVVQAMDAAIKELDGGEFKEQPLVEARLREIIGQTLWSLGRNNEAEPHLRRALELYRKFLPAGRAELAVTLYNLASVLKDENQLDEAEALYREALADRRRALPAGHPDIARYLMGLADLYGRRHNLTRAETTYREALEINRKALPAENPQTAENLCNLGELMRAQQRLAEAEALEREGLGIDRKAFPAEHPKIAEDLARLARVLQAESKTDGAEALLLEALGIEGKSLPAAHPLIANTEADLARLLRAKNKPDEAEKLYRDALEIRRNFLPPGHPEIARTLNELTDLLLEKKQYSKCVPLLSEALEIERKSLPPGDLTLITSARRLARVLQVENRAPEAEPLFREALEARLKALPPAPLDIATSQNELAEVLLARKNMAEAEPLLIKALEVRRKLLPADSPDVAASVSNLGELRMGQNNLPDAEQLYVEALEIRRKASPAGDISKNIKNLAVVLQAENKLEKAEALFREAMEIRRKTHPATSVLMAYSASDLAGVLLAENKPDKAEPLFRQALDIQRHYALTPERELIIASDLSGLGRALAQLGGNSLEAEANLRGALLTQKRQLGVKDPATTRTAAALVDLLTKTGSPAAAVVRAEFELDSPPAPQTQPIRTGTEHE